jgi:hypothetical protein
MAAVMPKVLLVEASHLGVHEKRRTTNIYVQHLTMFFGSLLLTKFIMLDQSPRIKTD